MDSEASPHMMSKSDLTPDEKQTIRKSNIHELCLLLVGRHATEEATIYVNDLDMFLQVPLLKESPAVFCVTETVVRMNGIQVTMGEHQWQKHLTPCISNLEKQPKREQRLRRRGDKSTASYGDSHLCCWDASVEILFQFKQSLLTDFWAPQIEQQQTDVLSVPWIQGLRRH